jgi:hypothetical protein
VLTTHTRLIRFAQVYVRLKSAGYFVAKAGMGFSSIKSTTKTVAKSNFIWQSLQFLHLNLAQSRIAPLISLVYQSMKAFLFPLRTWVYGQDAFQPKCTPWTFDIWRPRNDFKLSMAHSIPPDFCVHVIANNASGLHIQSLKCVENASSTYIAAFVDNSGDVYFYKVRNATKEAKLVPQSSKS